MISHIAGTLKAINEAAATIDQPALGMGFEVLLPGYLASDLAMEVGNPIELHTFVYLESQGQGTSFVPRLVGFAQPDERRFFEVFTRVKGLGTRKALKAMIHPPAIIASQIASEDVKGLQQMPGIGKRLAQTIIAELSGKIESFIDPGIAIDPDHPHAPHACIEAKPGLPDPVLSSLMASGFSASVFTNHPELTEPVSTAMEVLMALGQTQSEAQRALERTLAHCMTDANIEIATLTSETLVAMVFGQG